MLILKFGLSVKDVSWTSEMKEWTEADCKNVGRSMAIFMRMVQTSDDAVDAWRKNYPQLGNLFQVNGFNEFMVVIATNLLRNNKYGMIFRVSVGAALSTLDGATDIYVITTYYQSNALIGQAHALLAMISINMIFQIIVMLGLLVLNIHNLLLYHRPQVFEYLLRNKNGAAICLRVLSHEPGGLSAMGRRV